MSSRQIHRLACRRRSPGKRTLRTYEDVVGDYVAEYRRSTSVEMRWYASRPNLETVVELAAMSRTPDDKRHPHQRRLPESALRAAQRRLSKCNLNSCGSFDELHEHIDDVIRNLDNIGELAVYDIACRIGAFLNLEPERVYLHRGTRDGARILGIVGNRKTLEVDELPTAFHILKPREIEDCLCIYRRALRKIVVGSARRSR